MTTTGDLEMQSLKTQPKIGFSPLLRRYTLEEFWELPEPEDNSHYDLIGGHLFMVPPPNPPHGTIDSRLVRLLFEFLIANNIQGEVHHPKEPIYRHAKWGTYLEPDMMFVSTELAAKMGERRTSADIIFEYLSKSTEVYDRTTKADTYLALDVKELWLIDPVSRTIEICHALVTGESREWEVMRYGTGESAASRLLSGWEVSVDKLFDKL
jgi:Uma2 family endonuclease